ncbi:oligosaccharide flippase family protein [Longirhabdus pacifica]|uniref:oligosaccharide flippase family protein n=1 Tax=Longirhabdus pacifica TaxID=2305227 RepID=UPI0010091A51|nr:oligosaccharide flippase family protein [Longirhabdus pacifica]
MLIKNSKLKAGSFYLFGNVFNKAIAFLTIPIFTRLLTTSEYGMVSTYISWVTIVGAFIGLSLGSSIRSVYNESKPEVDAYISSILFLSMVNFLLTTFLVLLIIKLAAFEVDKILVLLCFTQAYMTTVINAISIKYMMGFQYVKKTLLLAVPNIIVAVLSIILILKMDDMKHMGSIWSYFIVYSIIGTLLFFISMLKGKTIINISFWRYGLKFSLPLIFHGLSLVMLAQSDRIMITAFKSASETGVYSLVYNFSMVAIVVTTSLESIWIPWFNERLKKFDKKIINSKVKYYIASVLYINFMIMLVAPDILFIIAPIEYEWGVVLIPPIVASSYFIFLNSFSINLEYYYKKTRIIATNTVLIALINIGLNYILIPQFGAIAAAYTTLFSYGVSFLLHCASSRKIDSDLFPFKTYALPLIGLLSSVIITYTIMDYTYIRWGLFLLVSSIFTIYVIKNRSAIYA